MGVPLRYDTRALRRPQYDNCKDSSDHYQPVAGILLHDDCGSAETEPDNVYRMHSYWSGLRGECVVCLAIAASSIYPYNTSVLGKTLNCHEHFSGPW